MKIKKLGALLVSVALCAGMAAPAFAYGGEPVEEVEQPVLTSTTDEEDVVTVTDDGFMPAVELSYIKPKNQRLIAVSIDEIGRASCRERV